MRGCGRSRAHLHARLVHPRRRARRRPRAGAGTKQLDLTAPASGNANLQIADGDIETNACLDMRADQVTGAPTELVGGQVVPVCDVDNSCSGAAPDAPCHNLDEVCGGGDPFSRFVEPP